MKKYNIMTETQIKLFYIRQELMNRIAAAIKNRDKDMRDYYRDYVSWIDEAVENLNDDTWAKHEELEEFVEMCKRDGVF